MISLSTNLNDLICTLLLLFHQSYTCEEDFLFFFKSYFDGLTGIYSLSELIGRKIQKGCEKLVREQFLWNKDAERKFFENYITQIEHQIKKYKNQKDTNLEKLREKLLKKIFYKDEEQNTYYAFWPKTGNVQKGNTVVQGRNSLIGNYTEEWTKNLLEMVLGDIAKESNYKEPFRVVRNVVCEDLGLSKDSPADIVLTISTEAKNTDRKTKTKAVELKPEEILVIFEVKMSIVWNWKYSPNGVLDCIGDFTKHQGNPGLLRSDTVLKAVGKCIMMRVNNPGKRSVPIVVLGNTPITRNYERTVDNLKNLGFIQGFYSLNPKPFDAGNEKLSDHYLMESSDEGFITVQNYAVLKDLITKLINTSLKDEKIFFSSWKSTDELGKIIKDSCGKILKDRYTKEDYRKIAELFLMYVKDGVI